MDYYELYEPFLIEFEDDLKDWIKKSFKFIHEVSLIYAKYSQIMPCTKTAIILNLLRYILKKRCNCDEDLFVCEHHFIDVWPRRLAKATRNEQSEGFLKKAYDYFDHTIKTISVCLHRQDILEHLYLPFACAFKKYRNFITSNSILNELSYADITFNIDHPAPLVIE
nr:hypothetical transcript [Hymenolepis microstoma]